LEQPLISPHQIHTFFQNKREQSFSTCETRTVKQISRKAKPIAS
jgi:shikimate kinase